MRRDVAKLLRRGPFDDGVNVFRARLPAQGTDCRNAVIAGAVSPSQEIGDRLLRAMVFGVFGATTWHALDLHLVPEGVK